MKLEANWKYKSLEHLEKKSWGNVDDASTILVKRCLQLAKIPLNEFTVEDLRMMIAQKFGLIYLVPLALEALKVNILAEGDYYPGDLLKSVTNVDEHFWGNNEHLRGELNEVIKRNQQKLKDKNISLGTFPITN